MGSVRRPPLIDGEQSINQNSAICLTVGGRRQGWPTLFALSSKSPLVFVSSSAICVCAGRRERRTNQDLFPFFPFFVVVRILMSMYLRIYTIEHHIDFEDCKDTQLHWLHHSPCRWTKQPMRRHAHARTQAGTHARPSARMHIRTHARTKARRHTHTHARTHECSCTNKCIYARMNARTYTRPHGTSKTTRSRTHACTHNAHRHTHAHTHTHTHTPARAHKHRYTLSVSRFSTSHNKLIDRRQPKSTQLLGKNEQKPVVR